MVFRSVAGGGHSSPRPEIRSGFGVVPLNLEWAVRPLIGTDFHRSKGLWKWPVSFFGCPGIGFDLCENL
jgi:hypothetical protein